MDLRKNLISFINWSGEYISKERGEAYFYSQLINVTRSSDNFILATIKGSSFYQTTLEWNYNRYDELALICSCTCPAYKRFQEPCKHVWGLMLYCDNHKNLYQNFYVELNSIISQDNIDLLTHWEEDDDDYSTYEYQEELCLNETIRMGSDVKENNWENKLSSFERYLKLNDPSESQSTENISTQSKTFLWYEIESYAGMNFNPHYKYLDISLYEVSVFKNGRLGKLRPKNFQERMLDSKKYQTDEKYLQLLAGFFKTKYYLQTNMVSIPTSLSKLVLKELESSSRLFARTSSLDSASEIQPILISKDTLYFKANIEKDEEKNWVLGGVFVKQNQNDLSSLKINAEEAYLTTDFSFIIHDNVLYATDFGKLKNYCEYIVSYGNIHIPEKNKDELKKIIKKTIGLEQTLLDQEFDIEKKIIQGKAKIEINFDTHNGHSLFSAKLYFLYENEIHSPLNSRKIYHTAGLEDLFLIKDRHYENKILQFIVNSKVVANIEHLEEYLFNIDSHHLNDFVQEATAFNIEVRTHGHKLKFFHTPVNQISTNQDWFELSGSIRFENDKAISIPEILKKKEYDKNFIILDDGTLGIKPVNWLIKMKSLGRLGQKEGNQLKFNKAQSMILDFLLEDLAVDRDKKYQELLQSLKSFKKIERVKHSKHFNGELRAYQNSGLNWLNFLYAYSLGGCLADDMGLGKTIQVLAHLQRIKYLKHKAIENPHLIIVPKSLLHNWQAEANKFTEDLSVLIYEGSKRDELLESFHRYDIIIMTYAVLRLDIQKLKDITFSYAILDEAQNIKNSSTLVAKASYLINANHRLALTGTPIENHLGELFSIFKFLIPNLLPASYASGKITSDKKSMSLILKGLMPFILRRTKDEVLTDLPDKVESILFCDFESKQEKIYNEMKEFYQKSLTSKITDENLNNSKIQILEALLRMRQVSCHPALINSDYHALNSSKMIMLLETIIPLVEKGEKVLIFSQFTKFLKLISKHLDKHNLHFCYLDGQTTKRSEVVTEFKTNPKKNIFLISLKAGGVGLNLTEANYCFLVDPWWNPAVESQAIDRIHRIGQKKKVFAYRLITRNSIEEKILKLQQDKKTLTKDLLTTDESLLRQLEIQDLAFLFH